MQHGLGCGLKDFHYKDKTVSRSSYLLMEILYIERPPLYWDGPRMLGYVQILHTLSVKLLLWLSSNTNLWYGCGKTLSYSTYNLWDHFSYSWWRHQMETLSPLLALCAWNPPVTGDFPAQRPATRSFDVFFDLNGWVNNREAGDLRRHRAHYDVTVIVPWFVWSCIILAQPISQISYDIAYNANRKCARYIIWKQNKTKTIGCLFVTILEKILRFATGPHNSHLLICLRACRHWAIPLKRRLVTAADCQEQHHAPDYHIPSCNSLSGAEIPSGNRYIKFILPRIWNEVQSVRFFSHIPLVIIGK